MVKTSAYPRRIDIMRQVIDPTNMPNEMLDRIRDWCKDNCAWIVSTNDLFDSQTVRIAWGRDQARSLVRTIELRMHEDGTLYATATLYKSPEDVYVLNTEWGLFKRKRTSIYEFTETELEQALDLLKSETEGITEERLKNIPPIRH